MAGGHAHNPGPVTTHLAPSELGVDALCMLHAARADAVCKDWRNCGRQFRAVWRFGCRPQFWTAAGLGCPAP